MSKYDEIMELPHHVSETRARMSRQNRAAQFSSFAALTGYEEGIAEAARLTESRIERSEEDMCRLNERLMRLSGALGSRPEIEILYFAPDGRKSGGSYLRRKGRLRRIDEESGCIEFEDRSCVPLEDIYELEAELFQKKGIETSIDMRGEI